MKYTVLLITAFLLFSFPAAKAQKYLTKNGHIWFFSQTSLENIEAHNKQAASALDFSTGEFVFKLLIKSFQFDKALMQEHFNENYMESDKYPNSTFSGKITDIKNVDLKKDGVYKVNVEGDLTIRGVAKKINVPGTIEVKQGKLYAKSKFSVEIADYNITIPKAVAGNIAKSIDINVDIILESANK